MSTEWIRMKARHGWSSGKNTTTWQLTRSVSVSLTPLQLWDAADRSYTLERMFNIREGLTRAHDTLPERYFTHPTPAGLPMAKGKCIDRAKFEQMLDEYYELHEWDNSGIPTEGLLRRLGIDSEPSHLL